MAFSYIADNADRHIAKQCIANAHVHRLHRNVILVYSMNIQSENSANTNAYMQK